MRADTAPIPVEDTQRSAGSERPASVPPEVPRQYAQRLAEGLERLPTLAPVAARLLQLTASMHTGAKDLVEVIETDQAIASRLLRLVNSAAVGLREPVTSIAKATVLLGFNAVRSCALSVLAVDTFRQSAGHSPFDQTAFWKHGIAVACASWMLARQGKTVDPEEAFTAGLLHDLGRLALGVLLPDAYEHILRRLQRACISSLQAERDVLGTTHTRLGALVADHWHLPAVLKNAAVLHHTPPRVWPASLPGAPLLRLVLLADRLCRQQHIGLTGRYPTEPSVEALAAEVGVTREAVEAVIRELPDQIEQRAHLLDLGSFDANTIYLEGLRQANVELGRFTEALLTANLRLARQQEAIDADLRLAARIQQTIVPVSQACGRVRVEVAYQPMLGIGGDYACVHLQEQGPSRISIGDVAGHGIAAALVASRIHGEVRDLVRAVDSPGQVLVDMNRFLCQTFADSEVLTSFATAVLVPETGRLSWASGAQPPILHYRRSDGQVQMLASQATFLGVAPDLLSTPLEDSARIEPGDLLFFYTDGLIEAANADGDHLGVEGLTAFIQHHAGQPVEAIAPAIFKDIADYRAGPPQDDMMLLVVTCTA